MDWKASFRIEKTRRPYRYAGLIVLMLKVSNSLLRYSESEN
jgi:hypothetical protein